MIYYDTAELTFSWLPTYSYSPQSALISTTTSTWGSFMGHGNRARDWGGGGGNCLKSDVPTKQKHRRRYIKQVADWGKGDRSLGRWTVPSSMENKMSRVNGEYNSHDAEPETKH